MPAKSAKQRRAAGAALGMKKSGKIKGKGPAAKMARSMTKKELGHFAKKKKSKK